MINANLTTKNERASNGDLICYSDVNLPKAVNRGLNTYEFTEEVNFSFRVDNDVLNLNKETENFIFYNDALTIIQPNGKIRCIASYSKTIQKKGNFLPNGVKEVFCI